MEKKTKLIVTLRVKNAILFIKDWLACYEKLADGIVVVDNGSDDGTYEILKSHPHVLAIQQTFGFDEGRDFQILLDMAASQKPEWLLTVDGDEIFEHRLTRKKLERMMANPFIKHYRFRRFHMYRDEHHYMATPQNIRSLGDAGDRSLYRFSPSLKVPKLHIHTSIMGRPKFYWQSSFRIKHLPMLHKEYRLKAYQTYLEVDKDANRAKMYQRDIDDLNKPDQVKVKPFVSSALRIKIEYLYYNFLMITSFSKRALDKIKS